MTEPAPKFSPGGLLQRARRWIVFGTAFAGLLALPLSIWGQIEGRKNFHGVFQVAVILVLLLTWGWDALARGNLDVRPRRKR